MKHDSWTLAFVLVCFVAYALPHSVMAEQTTYLEKDYYFYEPGPVMKSQLYLDGSTVEFETGSLIYPVTGSDLSRVTPEEFRNMALEAREAFENAPNKTIISPDRDGRGINIVFNCTNVPAAALAALESVAVYIEQLFEDDVTVSINITFAPLGPGIIGSAQSYFAGNPSWAITQASLVSDMDADDSIQTWLPSTSTIPMRYDYGSATVTDENRVYFVVAPYNAVIGSYPSLAAQITFSTNFTFDYEPWNGVSGMCFQSIAAHEIGHVLGFISGADFLSNDIEVLDIYRFQNTDGAGNYNPDTWYDFQNTARMVDLSPGIDDVNSDMIAVEYRMSDGNPYQASHFSQNNVSAMMQPAFSNGQTYYPYFYRVPDRVMFDAIGWDYIMSYFLGINISGGGSVERNPDSFSYVPGTSVELTAIPDAGWEFFQWSGSLTGNANPANIVMDYDKVITATFQTLNCTLTTNTVGNGVVNRVPDLPYYPRGDSVELTAVPDPGWVFSYWSGHLWGSQNPDTIVMNGDKTVYANFTYTGVEENKLTMTDGNYFNITPNPSSGRVEMRYSIGDAGNTMEEISLEIYNATGQLVKSFDPVSSIQYRESSITWSGVDDANRQLGSGVYFVKFRAADFSQTTKLLLIR